MVKKRGQAAMEFLMTYGWALLVVLVAIGALAFFGVLNPARFLPETCTITPGISCNDFIVTNADGVTIVIQNGMGKDLTAMSLASTGATVCADSSAEDTLGDGVSKTFKCDFTNAPDAGSRYKGTDDVLSLAYTESISGNDITHAVPVNLIAEVQ
jgi:hypothetical protein